MYLFIAGTTIGTYYIVRSAGVGRTGTFIIIDMELQRIKHEGIGDVYNTIHKLRFRRNFTDQ